MNDNEKKIPPEEDGFLPDSGFTRQKTDTTAPGGGERPAATPTPQKSYAVRRAVPLGTRPVPRPGRPQQPGDAVNKAEEIQPKSQISANVHPAVSSVQKPKNTPQPVTAAQNRLPENKSADVPQNKIPVPGTASKPVQQAVPKPPHTPPGAEPSKTEAAATPKAQQNIREPLSSVQDKQPEYRIYSPISDKTAIHDAVTNTDSVKPTKIVNLSAGGIKKHKAASGTKSAVKALIYIVAVLTFSLFLSYAAIIIANDAFAFVKADEEITVTIPELMTTSELAEILHTEGVIKYPFIFKIYCGRNAKDVEFVAGEYVINANSSYDELFATFKKSTKRETVRIAFPEGSTIDEIIALLVENGVGCTEGFKEVINNYDFSSYEYEFLEGVSMTEDKYYRLEGFLFPDTYDFYKARGIEEGDGIYLYQDEVNAVVKFLDRFNQIFTSDLKLRAEELDMSIEEVITLASIIEKEGKFVVEFEKISSVFHNRLKNKATYPKLQSDATIAYAMQCDSGSRPEELTGKDTEYDSVYNTYLYAGLPPGAIANPGYNAITCALYPATTEYYFFVSKKDGTTLFAKTEEEQLENIIIARGE